MTERESRVGRRCTGRLIRRISRLKEYVCVGRYRGVPEQFDYAQEHDWKFRTCQIVGRRNDEHTVENVSRDESCIIKGCLLERLLRTRKHVR